MEKAAIYIAAESPNPSASSEVFMTVPYCARRLFSPSPQACTVLELGDHLAVAFSACFVPRKLAFTGMLSLPGIPSSVLQPGLAPAVRLGASPPSGQFQDPCSCSGHAKFKCYTSGPAASCTTSETCALLVVYFN